MKARILFILLISFGFVQASGAQSHDTLPEVLVEAKSWTANNTSIYSQKLDENDIESNSSNSVYEAFNKSAGANFIQYGASGLVSPRIRGTNPEHLAVVWNGININHAGLGQSNGFNIPLQSADNFQLLYGGGSVPFGSGAIGGAILMDDNIQFRKEENVRLGTSYGSFETFKVNGKYRISNQKTFASISYYRNQSQNNFEYVNTRDFRRPLVKQNNAAFLQNGITASLAHKLGKKDQIRFHGWLHDGITEVQPTMNNRTSDDRQLDQMHRYKLSYLRNAQFAFIELDAFYTSDDINFNGQYTGVDRFGSRARISKRFFKFLQSGLGVNSEVYVPEYKNFPENTNETRISFFAFESLEYKKLNVQFNLRYTYVKGYDAPLTPNFSTSYDIIKKGSKLLRLKGSYSENFRLPTLNERYWIPNANPDILPEESRQVEYGFEAGFKKLKLDLVYYHLDIRNAVQWVIRDSLWSDITQTLYVDIFSPENINRIKGHGINSNVQLHKMNIGQFKVSAGLSYNYTIARENESSLQRLYTPVHTSNIHSSIEFSDFSLGAGYQLISERRTSSNYLDAYELVNLSISKRIKFQKHHFDMAFNVSNLLNETYQTYINRAMPGRNYQLTIRYNFNFNENLK